MYQPVPLLLGVGLRLLKPAQLLQIGSEFRLTVLRGESTRANESRVMILDLYANAVAGRAVLHEAMNIIWRKQRLPMRCRVYT